MLAELGAGDRRADAKAAVLGCDLVHLGDALHVDESSGSIAAAQLHEQVGAAREHARVAARRSEQRDCQLQCLRGLVTHDLGASPLLARASAAPRQTTLRSAKVNGTRRRSGQFPPRTERRGRSGPFHGLIESVAYCDPAVSPLRLGWPMGVGVDELETLNSKHEHDRRCVRSCNSEPVPKSRLVKCPIKATLLLLASS